MPRKDSVAWNTMIIANSMHGNGEEYLLLFKRMVNSGVKVSAITFTGVLSGCSHSRLVDEGLLTFHLLKKDYDRGIRKEPGYSWVQTKNKVHTFVVGDKNNENSGEIYRFLKEIGEKMRLARYFPDTGYALQDLDQEEKVDTLCNHREKLAVAFGILNLIGGSSVKVFKNLRICGDCHTAIKLIAKIVGVQIIVRDSLRFYHFKDGLCSCTDFW